MEMLISSRRKKGYIIGRKAPSLKTTQAMMNGRMEVRWSSLGSSIP